MLSQQLYVVLVAGHLWSLPEIYTWYWLKRYL